MNNERNNTTAGGIGFCGLLAVAFILDGRNNWQGSSLHKWIEKQFSTGGDGHE